MADLDVARLRAEYQGPHELVKTSDGKTLFVRRWNSKKEAPVSVLIFHGFTAYSGPYGQIVADQLSDSGFDVFGLDLRGHGLSDGRRGDYPSKQRFVDDVKETVALVRSKSRKLVVMGQSLGALVAIVAVTSSPAQVDGLVLASVARQIRPGVYPRRSAGAALKILLAVAVLPGSRVIEYRREGQTLLPDPLMTYHYSPRFYSVLFGASALKVMRMYSSGLIDSPNITLDHKLPIPLLVAVGDQDELFSVEDAKKFCDSIDCDEKEFDVLPGTRHAIFPKGVWTPLVAWLGKKF